MHFSEAPANIFRTAQFILTEEKGLLRKTNKNNDSVRRKLQKAKLENNEGASDGRRLKKYILQCKKKNSLLAFSVTLGRAFHLSLALPLQVDHAHVQNRSQISEGLHDGHIGALFIAVNVELHRTKASLCNS